MVDVSWSLFVVASLVLIVTPGQDMVLVMSRSVAQGATAGVATAAGVSALFRADDRLVKRYAREVDLSSRLGLLGCDHARDAEPPELENE